MARPELRTAEPLPRLPASAVALVAFLLPALATLASFSLLRQQAERRTQARFERQAELVTLSMQDRLYDDVEVLQGYQALVTTTASVNAGQWRDYTEAIGFAARHPGIAGVGFVVPVTAEEAARLEEAERLAQPDFAIHPQETAHPDRFVVRFVEPSASNHLAVGYDLGTDRVRRAALEATRDTGLPGVASGIALVQDPQHLPAFLLAVPVYRHDDAVGTAAERRAALLGWVYAVFRAADLMRGLRPEGFEELHVRLFGAADGAGEPVALWDSAPDQADRPGRRTSSSLQVGNVRWAVTFAPRPAFQEDRGAALSWAVLGAGTLISLLLGGIVWSLSSTRSRAMALAERITAELRASDNHVRAVVDNAAEAILTYDGQGTLLSLNPAAESLFGVEAGGMVGTPVTDLIPAATDVPADGQHHQASGRRADGEEMAIEVAVGEMSDGGKASRVALVRDVTEQRRMEVALREGEERYRSLITGLREGVVMRDATGEMLACNQSAERILDLPAEQLKDRPFNDPRWAAVTEDGHPFPADAYPTVAAFRTGRSCSNVIMGVQKPAGNVAWISVSAEPMLRRGSAVPYAVITSFVDITERRQAEAALKASEHRLANILDGVPLGVFVMDAEGRPAFSNAAARKLMGRGIDPQAGPDQLATTYQAFVLGTNEPYPIERMPVVRALRGESSSVQDMEVRHDGLSVPLEVVATPVLDAAGRVEYAIAAFQDISARHAAEVELRASEERTRAVVDAMLEGLIIVNEEQEIESMNPAAESLFGYTLGELAGKPLALLMPPSLDPRETRRQGARNAMGRITEWEGRRKDGSLFPFELSLYSFETGGRRRWAGHIRDVSQRREVERLKKEFVATVSHELRTPLTSIRGSLGLLASGVLGELPDEAREMVAIAERNSGRLITLINDILDLERLEVGRLEMNIVRLSLAGVVQRAVESVQAMAGLAGVRLESGPADVSVMGDADRLVQVLVNLLSNAVKFSPAGATVRVDTLDLGKEAELRVSDQGRGIPASDLESIFERFQQVEASDAREKGGTGLGLAICRAIVEQHEGTIGVTSAMGQGSTFWLRVPRPEVAIEDGLLSSMQSAPGDACDVLMVDDDTELLGVLARQLLREGLSVKVATTVEEGVRRAQEAPVRLMVLDLGLPDGDGREVIRALRADPTRADTPLLVYTARETNRLDREALTLGPTRFLMKAKSTDAEFRRRVLDLLAGLREEGAPQ